MTDAFTLLGVQPRPWIDQDQLKTSFLKLSESLHPDRNRSSKSPTSDREDRSYAEINVAFSLLKSHRDRLALLWELETGAKAQSTANIPEDLAFLFIQVGRICRDAAKFDTERQKLTSPILKAQAFGQSLVWTQQLHELQSRVRDLENILESDLIEFDQQWTSLDKATRREILQNLHFRASCLQRWKDQLRERISQLAF